MVDVALDGAEAGGLDRAALVVEVRGMTLAASRRPSVSDWGSRVDDVPEVGPSPLEGDVEVGDVEVEVGLGGVGSSSGADETATRTIVAMTATKRRTREMAVHRARLLLTDSTSHGPPGRKGGP